MDGAWVYGWGMSLCLSISDSGCVMERAADIIAGIDRTPLGRFAVDDESFYKSVVKHLRSIESLDDKNEDGTSDDDDFDFIPLADAGGGFYANVEVAFLMKTDKLSYLSFDDRWRERFELLRLASSHPSRFHDYLAVGIRDTGYIEKCLVDGVDAELASSVRKS